MGVCPTGWPPNMVAVPVAGCGCAPNTDVPLALPNEKPGLAGWLAAVAPNVPVPAAPNSGACVRGAPNMLDAEEAAAPNPAERGTREQTVSSERSARMLRFLASIVTSQYEEAARVGEGRNYEN